MEEFNKQVRKYQEAFGLNNWVIEVLEDDTLTKNAMTKADPRYCRAVISFSPKLNSIEFPRIVLHEMIHIVNSSYDFLVDNYVEDTVNNTDKINNLNLQREHVTSQMTEILLRLFSL